MAWYFNVTLVSLIWLFSCASCFSDSSTLVEKSIKLSDRVLFNLLSACFTASSRRRTFADKLLTSPLSNSTSCFSFRIWIRDIPPCLPSGKRSFKIPSRIMRAFCFACSCAEVDINCSCDWDTSLCAAANLLSNSCCSAFRRNFWFSFN